MQITTARLLLRDFTADDWPAVLAYQSDPRYLRYYAWTSRSEAEVRAFVQLFLDQQVQQPRLKYQFAIVLPDEGRLIGNCGIRRQTIDATEADMGYELAPDYWGRGYATEAARALVAFGFGTLGVHRISAHCIAENTASAHVLEKLGMRREGHLRETAFFKGRWWDTLIYGMLDRDQE